MFSLPTDYILPRSHRKNDKKRKTNFMKNNFKTKIGIKFKYIYINPSTSCSLNVFFMKRKFYQVYKSTKIFSLALHLMLFLFQSPSFCYFIRKSYTFYRTIRKVIEVLKYLCFIFLHGLSSLLRILLL